MAVTATHPGARRPALQMATITTARAIRLTLAVYSTNTVGAAS